MNDTQHLLAGSVQVDNADDNHGQRPFNKFLTWLQNFDVRSIYGEHNKQSDDSQDMKKSLIGFFSLFRFANRTDYLMLFIGLCAALVHSVCLVLYILLFGRLTGAFATRSIIERCHQMPQYSLANLHVNKCPLGIELNSFNFDKMHKFCSSNGTTSRLSSSFIATFHDNVNTKVYFLLIIGTIQMVCTFIQYCMFDLTANQQVAHISVRLFQTILQRSIPYFDINSTGQLNSKLFENISTLNKGIDFKLSTTFTMVCSMIGGIAVTFYINWQLALFMVCIISFIPLITHLFAKLVANETLNEFNAYSKTGQIVQEVFSSLRTVLSLNGGKFEQTRYERELNASRWNSVRKGTAVGVYVGFIYFNAYLIYATGFIFGSLLMQYEGKNKLNISDILVVTITFAQSSSRVASLSTFIQSNAEARGALTPVFRLIDEADGSKMIETGTWLDSKPERELIDGDIQFDNVNFTYPTRQDTPILRDFTLRARVGETTALVGLSGSGKSTCVALLLRYYEPLSGRIMINGRSLTKYHIKQLRQNIGVVNQEPILFNTSIYENIRYGKEDASRTEIEEAAQQANAHNFIMRLPNKYDTLVGEHGMQLSGGEKQRVALARALVKKPALLLLDEATSALDSASEKIIHEALIRACKDRTTIVIAHRLSTIQNAHRIYVLADGRVIEEGTHETLMAKEGSKYQEMVNAQKTIQIVSSDDMTKAQAEQEDEKHLLEHISLQKEIEIADARRERSFASNRKSILLRLLAMISSEWPIILLGCMACAAAGATRPLFAMLLSQTVNSFDECAYAKRRRQVLIDSFQILLLGLTTLIIYFFQYTAFAMSGSKLTQRLRAKAFACLLRQELAYFDRPENSSGAICGRLSSDALAVQQMVGTRVGICIETVAMFCFGLVLGCFFSWQFTLIVFLFVILAIILASIQIYSQARLKKRTRLIHSRASSLAVEVIQNMRTVKQLTLEKEFMQQFTKFVHQSVIIRRHYMIISAIIFAVYWSMTCYIMAALYASALAIVETNKLQTHNTIMVFAFATFSIQFIRIVMSVTNEMGASISAAQDFFDLFDRIPTIDNGSTKGQKLENFRGQIEFNQVTFVYPSRPASPILNKFQLSIKSGQRVALVGASGCGKSTIVQLLERFYDVNQGQLLLDGVDIRQCNIHWVRSCIGLVSQEPVLFDLTIDENIAYGLENISIEAIIDAAIKANIHQFIQKLPQGYKTKVGQKGIQLSGGEKQRIAVARAFLRRPKLLILDEATSAIDLYNEQIMQQALQQAQIDDPTQSSLIIAHRLSTIRECDLICVLDKGYIVESGTHIDLIQRRGIYYQMLFHHSL